jgi:tRNA U34 2-thiouridine synthase MnmA/TrmU
VNHVKLRYRSAPVPCAVQEDLEAGEHPRLVLELGDAVDGAAPGQTACLMCNDTVVGWGTISEMEGANAA